MLVLVVARAHHWLHYHGIRLNENIRLLKMHQDKALSAGGVDVPLRAEILTIRLGSKLPFRLAFHFHSIRADRQELCVWQCSLTRENPKCARAGFVLTTFPGELSVKIGLELKAKSPHPDTFFACYSNGYIFYSPTEDQLANSGAAQEDCDVMLGAGWQRLYERALAKHLEAV